MTRLSAFFVVTAGSLALAACATTALETSKDAANLKALEKVYVVTNTGTVKLAGPTSPLLSDYLSATLVAKLSKSSIETRAVQFGGVDLNLTQDNLDKEIKAYGATQVMVIELTHATVTTDNVLYTGDIDVSIVDVHVNKAVWKTRAHVKAFTGWGVATAALDDSVEKIFAAMRADGLLLNLAPSSGS